MYTTTVLPAIRHGCTDACRVGLPDRPVVVTCTIVHAAGSTLLRGAETHRQLPQEVTNVGHVE